MKRFNINKRYLKRCIYMSIVIMPALLTGNIYKVIDTKVALETNLSSLDSLGSSLFLNLKSGQDNLSYILQGLTSEPEFQTLDVSYISKQINRLDYFNDAVDNVYVVNSEGVLIYGINDNLVRGITENPHITTALSGNPSYHSFVFNDGPFLQLAYPIFKDETRTEVAGALISTISFDAIFTILESINDDVTGMHAYIIDSSGVVLVESSNYNFKYSSTRIDIDQLHTQLDYDPTSEFTAPDGELSNGVYYLLDQSSWTLLVTVPKSKGVAIIDIISLLLGGLGAGSITTNEVLCRRRALNTSIIPEDNVLPPS